MLDPMTPMQCCFDFAVRLGLVLAVGWAGLKLITNLEK